MYLVGLGHGILKLHKKFPQHYINSIKEKEVQRPRAGKKSWELLKWQEFNKQVTLLRKQHGKSLVESGSKNCGDTCEVDYFAIKDILDFVDGSHEELKRLVRVKEILEECR